MYSYVLNKTMQNKYCWSIFKYFSDHGGQQDDDVVDNRRRNADRAAEAEHMGGNMFSVSVIRPDDSENALLRQLSVDQEFMSADWENPENHEDEDEQDDNDADHDDNDEENDSFVRQCFG